MMDVRSDDQRTLTGALPSSTFVLTHVEVFNWGAFAGRHSAQIDLEGTAIIGPTGSGKTTLVDALMTLITATPRYNLASTGGHESDRDLVSYIRGVTGAGNNSGDNEHIARPGKTSSGIAARFSNGDQHLSIAAIFWLDDSSSAATDLKRLWIFSQAGQQGLDDWLETHHAGGARALKQLGRDTSGLRVCNNKQEYLAHLRRFFEVGENAFTLLNRAAGLKQLNSIDEVFRELVLDDTSAFERAAEVAKEFDDLAAIHGELEIARQQQQSLKP
ncbi:MAG TPA: ATP-binding protein, partial [Steroidobacteraceae bacterium]|nr:ATP-binding protein [Steroidobacteraceae bacterium]